MRIAATAMIVVMSSIALGCGADRVVDPATAGVDAVAARASGPQLALPSNVTAVSASQSRIDVQWQDNSSNETGFEIQRSTTGPTGSFGLLATTGPDVTAHSDLGLSAATQYCYRARTVGVIGKKINYSGFSAAVCATTQPAVPPPPPPPSAYTVSASPWNSSTVEIRVLWTDASTAPAFRKYRSTDGGTVWELLGSSNGTTTLFHDYSRAAEQSVCYRVVAYNAGGDAAPSSAGCTTPPAEPTNLIATVVDAETLELTWTDNSAVEDRYQVWLSGMRKANCEEAGGSEYWILVADLPSNSTMHRVPALPFDCHDEGQTYNVVATNDGGQSTPVGVSAHLPTASALMGSVTPLTPDAEAGRAASVAGSYVLSLLMSGPELVLEAHIQAKGTGIPADGGTATFQVCLLKGGPTLQMVPLPSAECVKGGSGTWTRLARIPVNASGYAAMNFGIAPRIATVGFRFEYSGLRGGVASGVSLPVDFVP